MTNSILQLEDALLRIAKLEAQLKEKDVLIETLTPKISVHENKVPLLEGYIFPTELELQFIQSTQIKTRMYIFLLKDFPCRVVDVKTSSASKYGNCKVCVTGICLIDNKKYQEIVKNSDYFLSFKKIEEIIEIRCVNKDGTFLCSKDIVVNSVIPDAERLKLALHDRNILGSFITIPIKIKDKEYVSNIILRDWE